MYGKRKEVANLEHNCALDIERHCYLYMREVFTELPGLEYINWAGITCMWVLDHVAGVDIEDDTPYALREFIDYMMKLPENAIEERMYERAEAMEPTYQLRDITGLRVGDTIVGTSRENYYDDRSKPDGTYGRWCVTSIDMVGVNVVSKAFNELFIESMTHKFDHRYEFKFVIEF